MRFFLIYSLTYKNIRRSLIIKNWIKPLNTILDSRSIATISKYNVITSDTVNRRCYTIRDNTFAVNHRHESEVRPFDKRAPNWRIKARNEGGMK